MDGQKAMVWTVQRAGIREAREGTKKDRCLPPSSEIRLLKLNPDPNLMCSSPLGPACPLPPLSLESERPNKLNRLLSVPLSPNDIRIMLGKLIVMPHGLVPDVCGVKRGRK